MANLRVSREKAASRRGPRFREGPTPTASDSVPVADPQGPGTQHQTTSQGLIVRQKNPDNLETPPHQLGSFLTPTESFYVRSHFPVPKLDSSSYQLWIDGAVRKPFSLSYAELRSLPSETRVVTLECAGNSRAFLNPKVKGVQWEMGAVGNAEWTGVPLRTLLKRAGLKEEACEVVLEGADRGTVADEAAPAGPMSYFRSLPRNKSLQPEVLIAYQMNGRDLSPDHGYPVRAIVPGHYAMASVKWLTRVHAVQQPFRGYWQTADYGYWEDLEGNPVRRALGEIMVKSQILRPGLQEILRPNQVYTVQGMAWAGETPVMEIVLSSDGGQTWARASFLDPVRRHSWRRWTFDWLAPNQPGRYKLFAQARGADGKVQPDRHDPNFGAYVINHTLPIEVQVGP